MAADRADHHNAHVRSRHGLLDVHRSALLYDPSSCRHLIPLVGPRGHPSLAGRAPTHRVRCGNQPARCGGLTAVARCRSLANEYAFWSIWGLIPNEVYYAVRQYFQAQGIVLPQLYNNMAFVAVNLVLNVVFVHGIGSWPGLGFVGSAIATSVSRTLQPLVFITYAGAWKGLHRQTWPDTSIVYWFTRRDVAEYFRQTLPTMIGNAIEQWVGALPAFAIAPL